MAAIRYFDRFTTTLASGYTSGGASLSLTAIPSGLGATDIWIFKVEAEGSNTEEVFLATAHSGSGPYTITATGAQAGTSASNHASGATVKGSVLTVDALDRIKRDTAGLLTVSQFDALSGNGGYQSVRLTDGLYEARWDGSAWKYFFGAFPVTRPVDGDFAWVNQGAATISTANGYPIMTVPNATGADLRLRKKTAPSPPYTITAGFLWSFRPQSGDDPSCGLMFRQSSSGKLITFGPYSNGTSKLESYVGHWNGPTSFGANVFGPQVSLETVWQSVIWVQISDDNTNRIYRISADGVKFLQLYSESRTFGFTCDEVGWSANNGSGDDHHVSLISWKES
jgi:hypothetical protein